MRRSTSRGSDGAYPPTASSRRILRYSGTHPRIRICALPPAPDGSVAWDWITRRCPSAPPETPVRPVPRRDRPRSDASATPSPGGWSGDSLPHPAVCSVVAGPPGEVILFRPCGHPPRRDSCRSFGGEPPCPRLTHRLLGAGLVGWVSSADRFIHSAPLPRAEALDCRSGVSVAAHFGRWASWGVRAGLSTRKREIPIEIPSNIQKSPTAAELCTTRSQFCVARGLWTRLTGSRFTPPSSPARSSPCAAPRAGRS